LAAVHALPTAYHAKHVAKIAAAVAAFTAIAGVGTEPVASVQLQAG
jgi:hypothetical protein